MLAISQGPVGGIAVLLATAVFLGLNFHHDMLRALAISFVELPAGRFGSPLPGIEIYIVLSRGHCHWDTSGRSRLVSGLSGQCIYDGPHESRSKYECVFRRFTFSMIAMTHFYMLPQIFVI